MFSAPAGGFAEDVGDALLQFDFVQSRHRRQRFDVPGFSRVPDSGILSSLSMELVGQFPPFVTGFDLRRRLLRIRQILLRGLAQTRMD